MNKRTKLYLIAFTIAPMLVVAFLLFRAVHPQRAPVFHPSESQLDAIASRPVDVPSQAVPIVHESQAKPVLEEPRSEGITQAVAHQAKAPPETPTLVYDPNSAFETNLGRLKALCSRDSDPRTLEFRLRSFLIQMFENVPADGAMVLDELQTGGGHPFYRTVLLACFMKADVEPKDDTLWNVALRQAEPESVRATATFLLSQAVVSRSRPADILQLIRDDNPEVKVSALQVAAYHMDQAVFDATRSLVVSNDDIHVRLAALSALGVSGRQDSQPILVGVVTGTQTAASAAFSPESVLKRSAVAKLDTSDPANLRLVCSIVADANEDPGVRRKALVRLAQSHAPEALLIVTSVLDSTPEAEAVVLKGCVEALLIIGTQEALGVARGRAKAISDQQVKRMLTQIIERSNSP